MQGKKRKGKKKDGAKAENPWRGKWQPTPVFSPGKVLRTEEAGRLQYMGLQRVRHD